MVEPRTSDIPFVLAMLFLAINILHYLMYSHRALGWVLTKLLARFVLPETVRLKVGSIMISPLSGRIMFADVTYFSRNSYVKVVDGYIKFKWWSELPEKELRGPDRTKLTIHLNGMRLALYNNIAKFEDFKEFFEKRGVDVDGCGDKEHVQFQGLQEDPSTASPEMAVNEDGKVLTANPPACQYQRIMKFLGHVAFDIREGTFALGAPTKKNPYYLQMAFKQFMGIHLLEKEFVCKEDLYRIVVDSSMKDLSMQVMKFKYRMGDIAVPQQKPCTRDDVESATPNAGGERDKGGDRTERGEGTNSPHSQSLSVGRKASVQSVPAAARCQGQEGRDGREAGAGRIREMAQHGKRLIMFAFYGDNKHGEDAEGRAEGVNGIEDETLKAMLAAPEQEYLTQHFGTILDPARPATLRVFYYQDVPGVELVGGRAQRRNVDELPKMGLNVDVYASQIAYGPFINLIRAQVQTLFFPWDLRTWGRYDPKVGTWRAFGAYEQTITFKENCELRVPWRKPKEGVAPPQGLVYSGTDHMITLNIGEGSQYLFKYPYVQVSGEGVITEAVFDLKNVTVYTSLNDDLFLRAKEMTVHMDCQYPSCYRFNELHQWDTIVSATEGEVYYMAEHGAYFGDFFLDFGYPGVMYLGEGLRDTFSGSHEFMIKEYAPYVQRFEVFLEHFDVKLCVNDGNVIERHCSEDNAMITWRLRELSVEYIAPADAFTVTQETEIASTLNLFVGHSELHLHLPASHEVYQKFPAENVQQCFGTIDEIRVSGNITAMYPDTHHAQGRPGWRPRRDIPRAWYDGFIRPPEVDTTHDMGDLSSLTVSIRHPVLSLHGWHLKYLGILGANYGGDDTSYVTAAEYLRWADKHHPHGRNLRATYFTYLASKESQPWKRSFSNIAIDVTAVQVYLPLFPQSVGVFRGRPVLERDVQLHSERKGPPTGIVKRGDALTVTNTVGQWACVRHNDVTGYVDKDLVSEAGARFWCNQWYYHARALENNEESSGEGDYADLSFYELRVELNTNGTSSDTALSVSPISVRCPLGANADIRSQQPEYYMGIEGVTVNMSTLCGPPPFCQVYCTSLKVHVGSVTGNLLMSQVVLLEQLGVNISAHLALEDPGLVSAIDAARGVADHTKAALFVRRGASHAEHDDPSHTAASLDGSNIFGLDSSIPSEVSQFKSWLALKASKADEAAKKAYAVRKATTDTVSLHLRLELGVAHAFAERVSFADSTYADRNFNKRGAVVVPLLTARLFMTKTGQQLRDMGGDHLEVGKITCAVRVRITSTGRTAHSQESLGHEAQKKYLQKFDLAKYGLEATLGVEEGWFGGDNMSGSGRKRWRMVSEAVGSGGNKLKKGFKSLAAAVVASSKEEKENGAQRKATLPNRAPPFDVAGLTDSVRGGGRRTGRAGEEAPPMLLSPEGTGGFELSPPSSSKSVSKEPLLGNPLGARFPRDDAEQQYSPREASDPASGDTPSRCSAAALIDADIKPTESRPVSPTSPASTASLVIHDGSAADPATPDDGVRTPPTAALTTDLENMSAMSDGDGDQYDSDSPPRVPEPSLFTPITHGDGNTEVQGMHRTGSGWCSEESPRMGHPWSAATLTGMDSCISEASDEEPEDPFTGSFLLSERRRLDIAPQPLRWGKAASPHEESRPPRTTASPDRDAPQRLPRRKSSAKPIWFTESGDFDASLMGFRFGSAETEDVRDGIPHPGDAPLAERDRALLQSVKLHQFRGVPLNTALMYGRGHLRGQCDYAYAPHPKVFFERTKGTQPDILRPAESAGSDSASMKHLLEPAQVYDTIENQRENTSTSHTHVSFLQPLQALVSQHAATLLIHGSALHTLWRGDLTARYGQLDVAKPAASEPRAETSTSPMSASKVEEIVSLQLAEAVVVCVIGTGDTEGVSDIHRVPRSLRCVAHNVNVVQSTRVLSVQRQSGGRQPGMSASIKVGSIGLALPHSEKPCCVQLPSSAPKPMRRALAPKDEPLLAYALLMPTASGDKAAPPPAVRIRCRRETTPCSKRAMHQVVLDLGALFTGLGHEVELVQEALAEVSYLSSLYSSMQHDPVLHPEEDAESDMSDSDSSSERSFVVIDFDNDADNPQSSGARSGGHRKSRPGLRKRLYGATGVVWDAMRRLRKLRPRRARAPTETFTALVGEEHGESPLGIPQVDSDSWVMMDREDNGGDGDGGTPAPPAVQPMISVNDAYTPPLQPEEGGGDVPWTAASRNLDDMAAESIPQLSLAPSSMTPMPAPSSRPDTHDGGLPESTPQHRASRPAGRETSITPPDNPQCPVGWIYNQAAVHLTVRVNELRVSVNPATDNTARLPHGMAPELPFLAIKSLDLRVHGRGERGPKMRGGRTPVSRGADITDNVATAVVQVPITVLLQVGAVHGEIEPAVVTMLRRLSTCKATLHEGGRETDTTSPTGCKLPSPAHGMAKAECAETTGVGEVTVYTPSLYLSAVVGGGRLRVKRSVNNYANITVRHVTCVVTNREDSLAVQRGAKQGGSDVEGTLKSSGQKRSLRSFARRRGQDSSADGPMLSRMSSDFGFGGLAGTGRPPTRSAGAETDDGPPRNGRDAEALPSYIVSIMIKNAKKAPAPAQGAAPTPPPPPHAVLVQYFCRTMSEIGDISEKPEEIFSLSTKMLSVTMLYGEKREGVEHVDTQNHVSVENLLLRVANHESFHTEHCLREWKKFVTRWELAFQAAPGAGVGDPLSPGADSAGLGSPLREGRSPTAPQIDPTPPPVDKPKGRGVRATVTFDLNRAELVLPMTTDETFHYVLRRACGTMKSANGVNRAGLSCLQSIVKVHDRSEGASFPMREEFLPGFRIEYHEAVDASVAVVIEKLEMLITPDILNAWIHVTMTIAPVMRRWVDFSSQSGDQNGDTATQPSKIARAKLVTNGVAVSFVGGCAEFVVTASRGTMKWRLLKPPGAQAAATAAATGRVSPSIGPTGTPVPSSGAAMSAAAATAAARRLRVPSPVAIPQSPRHPGILVEPELPAGSFLGGAGMSQLGMSHISNLGLSHMTHESGGGGEAADDGGASMLPPPASPLATHATPVAEWYVRFPRLGATLHDCVAAERIAQWQVHQARALGGNSFLHANDGPGQQKRPSVAPAMQDVTSMLDATADGRYRWGSLSLGMYLGNRDLDDLVQVDPQHDRAATRTAAPTLLRRQSYRDADSTRAGGGVSDESFDDQPRVNMLLQNPTILARAGLVETGETLHGIYVQSFKTFKETVGQDQKRFLRHEAGNLKQATRRRIKRQLRSVRQQEVDTLAISGVWSLNIRNVNVTVPFGDKAYWCCKALAFNHTDSMLEQACMDHDEEGDIPLAEVWSCAGGRLLPSQALQLQLGSASAVVLIAPEHTLDASTGRAPQPDDHKDPVRVVSVVRSTDLNMYFSDGQQLPKAWLPERDGQGIDPKHRWYREFGPNLSYVVGGRGVFVPPWRELAGLASASKSSLSVSDSTVRLRARVSKKCGRLHVPVKFTCAISGPKSELFPDIVSCVTDLAEDFVKAQTIGSYMKRAARLGGASVQLGAKTFSGDMHSDPSARMTRTTKNTSFMNTAETDSFVELDEAAEAAARPASLEVDFTCKIAEGTLRFKSDEPVPDTFRDKKGNKGDDKGDKASAMGQKSDTCVLVLPTPIMELCGVAKVPDDPGNENVVKSHLTAALSIAFPSEGLEVHPVAVYFTNKLAMWQQGWYARKAAWKDDIEARLDGLRVGLVESLRATHVGGCRIPHAGMHLTTKMTKDSRFLLFINQCPFLDVITPLPRGLINQAGCPPGCAVGHTVTCLRCGCSYAEHRDHMCPRSLGRAEMALFVEANGSIGTPLPSSQSPQGRMMSRDAVISPLTAPGFECGSFDGDDSQNVRFVSFVCPAQGTTAQLRVSAGCAEKDIKQACKDALHIKACWDVQASEQQSLRSVRLSHDELVDGETYVVDAVGPQVFLSVRLHPLSIAATTFPISDCRAVLETGYIDITATSSPNGVPTDSMVCITGQPLVQTNCVLRASVKDRLHECMSVGVTSLTAVLLPSEMNSVALNVGYAGGMRGAEQALRVQCRLGNLRSFLVVSRVWQEKSEEAKDELQKLEKAKLAAQSKRVATAAPHKLRMGPGTTTASRSSSKTERRCKQLLYKEILQTEGAERSQFVLVRVESFAADLDNFRVAHNNASTDKFQVFIDDAVFITKETSKVSGVLQRHTRHYDAESVASLPKHESAISEWSAVPSVVTNTTAGGSVAFETAQDRRCLYDARQTEVCLKSIAIEAHGRVVSPSTSKTSDLFLLRTRQLIRRADCHKYEEASALPTTALVCEIPPLDLEMREIYKPLFKLRLRNKMAFKPAITILLKDCYRPRVKPSLSQPLNTYHVSLSLVVGRVDLEIRPGIFPRLQQVMDEMQNTHQLQQFEAEKSLKTFTAKKARGRRERADTVKAASAAEIMEAVKEASDANSVVARGMFSVVVGETLVSLGHAADQGDCIQFGVKKVQLDLAQNLQRVGADDLWGLLDAEDGEAPDSPTRRDVGRVDRVIEPLVLTSWRIARQRGEIVETLLKADGDSLFKMHTNQYIGSNIVEYSFWSRFQNSWSVGKTDELVELKRWVSTFASEATTENDPDTGSVPPSPATEPQKAVEDARRFVMVPDGFTFKPVLQVVGDCTLPISAIFAPMGIEESMVPSALHSVVGDNIVGVLTELYASLAHESIIAFNRTLVLEFAEAHRLIAQEHQGSRHAVDGANDSMSEGGADS